jgi:hypothetical protein
MATESEKLKAQADQQHVEQRFKELSTYLSKLFLRIDKYRETERRHRTLVLLVLGTLFFAQYMDATVGGVWLDILSTLAQILFYIMIAREWLFIIPVLMGARDEIYGVLKTLEILGFIDPLDGGQKRKLKMLKESWIAKVWDALKSKKMQEAFT